MILVGILISFSNGLEVKCLEKLTKRISIFKAEKNLTSPYDYVNFSIPKNVCFIGQSITLNENETLSISAQNNEDITSIIFAAPSTLPEFPFEIFIAFSKLNEVRLVFSGIQ